MYFFTNFTTLSTFFGYLIVYGMCLFYGFSPGSESLDIAGEDLKRIYDNLYTAEFKKKVMMEYCAYTELSMHQTLNTKKTWEALTNEEEVIF